VIYPNSSIKGAFFGIPRDHQDGVGSCFANVARNMLIADSNGEVDASFLDLALQYKVNEDEKPWSVDGGISCEALEASEENGYCPKEFSPMESGELSNTLGGMFGEKTNNLKKQAYLLDKLKVYLKAKKTLENTQDIFSKKIISKTQTIIKNIKNNSEIKLPFPIIKKFPHQNKALPSLYVWSYSKIAKENGVKKENLITEEIFIKEMEKTRNDFIDDYTKYILTHSHDQKAVKALYDKHYDSVKKKYYLSDRFSGKYYQKHLNDFFAHDQKRSYERELDASEKFYKSLFGNDTDMADIKKEYSRLCNENADALLSYTKGLSDLIVFFKENKINTELLANSNKDILQLAIAPKCINAKNRIKHKMKFKCTNNHKNTLGGNKGVRKQILESLLLGHSVGNSHKGELYGYHINTLVGYRYNINTKRCEYKIRESQTALSTWGDEEEILAKVLRLTYLVERNK
jgi:hypothetical protein